MFNFVNLAAETKARN